MPPYVPRCIAQYASLCTLVVYPGVYARLCTLVVYPGVYARIYHPGYTMVYTTHPGVYRVPHSVYSVSRSETLGSKEEKGLGNEAQRPPFLLRCDSWYTSARKTLPSPG